MSGDGVNHESADETALLGAADIVAAFTALRHELKLQVRAGRDLAAGLEGAVAGCLDRRLDQMDQRFSRLEAAVGAAARQPSAAPGDQLRGLAAALAEVEESLDRALFAVRDQAGGLEIEPEPAADEPAAAGSAAAAAADWEECLAATPWWVRKLAAGLVARLRDVFDATLERGAEDGGRLAAAEESCALAAAALADAGQGLELLLVRTRRLMEQAGVRRLDVLHLPFDAERMRALDVVADADVPEGHVAEQFRPAYLLHGTVLRPAEVRVSR